jgi:hypothetical protein
VENQAPGGVGWTDVHIIQAPQHTYEDAGLTFAQAEAALTDILPRVREFAATASGGFGEGAHDPYGTYEKDAHCYGIDASCFVKLDGAGPLVRQIWFQAETRDAERLQALQRAIVAIDRLVPSVIADYWLDCTGAVGDAAFLGRYLDMLGDQDAD